METGRLFDEALGVTALQAVRVDQKREWRGRIVQVAMEGRANGR